MCGRWRGDIDHPVFPSFRIMLSGWIWFVLPWRPQPSCSICPQYIYFLTHTHFPGSVDTSHSPAPSLLVLTHCVRLCVCVEGQSTPWLRRPNHKTSSKIAKTTIYPTVKFPDVDDRRIPPPPTALLLLTQKNLCTTSKKGEQKDREAGHERK